MTSTKIIRVLIFINYRFGTAFRNLSLKGIYSEEPPGFRESRGVSAMVDVGTGKASSVNRKKQDHQKLHSPGRSKEAKEGDDSIHRSRISQHESDYQGVFTNRKNGNSHTIPFMTTIKISFVGYVLKDMVLKLVSDDEFQTRLSELMRPILSFNEDESLYQIWEKMLEKREHISIIVDEYGCLRG